MPPPTRAERRPDCRGLPYRQCLPPVHPRAGRARSTRSSPGRSGCRQPGRTAPARARGASPAPASTASWPQWVHPAVYAASPAPGSVSCGATSARRRTRPRRLPRRDGDRHASGKSMGYLVPVLSSLVTGAEAPNGRGATALYLSPTKALAADQVARLGALAIPGLRSATYDGDTPQEERRWIRDHAQLVLTNPDLVHHSLLPQHQRWALPARDCATWWSTSATSTAACSARTPRCCVGCVVWPLATGRSRPSSWPRPRCATRRRTRVVWSACPCVRWSGTARPAKP